jgi:hypothetical protein
LFALSTISTARGFWLHEGGVNFFKPSFCCPVVEGKNYRHVAVLEKTGSDRFLHLGLVLEV